MRPVWPTVRTNAASCQQDASASGGRGVKGQSISGIPGLLGRSPVDRPDYWAVLGAAVAGDSTTVDGVLGLSIVADGVHGITHASSGLLTGITAGVAGESVTAYGVCSGRIGQPHRSPRGRSGASSNLLLGQFAWVIGDSSGENGALGTSVVADGVHGIAHAVSGLLTGITAGVAGESDTADGVGRASASRTGVLGTSGGTSNLLLGQFAGVIGDSSGENGVLGTSLVADGVHGIAHVSERAADRHHRGSSRGERLGLRVGGASVSRTGVLGKSGGSSNLLLGEFAGVIGDSQLQQWSARRIEYLDRGPGHLRGTEWNLRHLCGRSGRPERR